VTPSAPKQESLSPSGIDIVDGGKQEGPMPFYLRDQNLGTIMRYLWRLKLALLVICLFADDGDAGTVRGFFTQYDVDCGGYVSGFVAHPSGRIYCRANVGGIYSSDDQGANWKWLSGDMPYAACHIPQAIAVAPSNVDIVYQAVGCSYLSSDPGRGVWKSTDGGRSWKQVLAEVNFSGNDLVQYGGPSLILHPGDENEVWATSRGQGLYRSLDGGAHWTRTDGNLFSGFNGASLCIHPRFPNQIWLTGESGLYLSLDRGAHWSLLRTCTRGLRVARFNDGTALVVGLDDSNKGFMWQITAGDWSDISTYSLVDKSSFFSDAWGDVALLTILDDDTTVVAGSYRQTKISYDRAASWQPLPMLMDATGYWPVWMRADETTVGWGRSELTQDPLDPARWYLVGGNTPVVSADGGAYWRCIPKGIGEVPTGKAVFDPSRPDLVFIPSGDSNCSIITDGGRSGTVQRSLYTLIPNPIATAGYQILIGQDRIVALYIQWGENGARLAVSHGDITSWTEIIPQGIPLKAFCDGVMSPDDPDDFLVLAGEITGPGQGGIYRTINGGNSFTQSTGFPNNVLIAANWSLHGYNNLRGDPGDPNIRYFMLSYFGFYRSEDRGSSWRAVGAGLPRSAGVLAQDPKYPGRLWAAMVTGGGGQPADGQGLYTSFDGGLNWSRAGDFSFNDPRIDAHSGRLVLFGKRPGDEWSKIYYSSDNGITWNEITRANYRFPTTNGLAINPHRPDEIWISTGGRSFAVFSIAPEARGDTRNPRRERRAGSK
jgi:photosystem II stability/assembly factor-like uncharacterized protein